METLSKIVNELSVKTRLQVLNQIKNEIKKIPEALRSEIEDESIICRSDVLNLIQHLKDKLVSKR